MMIGELHLAAAQTTSDYSISLNPNPITIVINETGNSGVTTVSVTSLSGFSSAVTLTQLPAAGIFVSFNPSSVTPESGGTATASATILLYRGITTGDYFVVIVGTSGGISHSVNLMIHVINNLPPPPPTFLLSVITEDTKGNQIYGYYNIFTCPRTTNLEFSPVNYSMSLGTTCSMLFENYGNFVFDHWQDTGSSDPYRVISITANTRIVAVYRNVTAPPPAGQSEIWVSTTDSSGNAITGYYTALFKGGVQLTAGFSPYSFLVQNDGTYQVVAEDYGQYMFSHWSDGTTDRFHTVNVPSTSTTVSLTAVYTPYRGDY
jgi:hypothetical protein